MSTVRVTLEAADDLPEPVREALQALITAATAGGMGMEYSYKPSPGVAAETGGHRGNGGSVMSPMTTVGDPRITTINVTSVPEVERLARVKAMKYGGR
ncbi:hypothetical protein QNA24_22460 [Rhodococcus qingshengii]|uniref:hypothetical protein n=1 Tax=Rhodococcus qingshengii TaxID=334542 RepID=UPI0024BB3F34|nr:hypothetical protein [Rhodococcus qingshengii]MDJ0489141.1 hypothetical protein [Rhodococcus qingshengii]